MLKELLSKKKKLSVVGLGYVGLPIALEFARKMSVIGFDIKEDRVAQMKAGEDPSKELESSAFENKTVFFTSDPEDIKEAVEKPISRDKKPRSEAQLKAFEKASKNKATNLTLKQAQNGVYYLPKGKYIVKIGNSENEFEIK